MGGTSPIPLTRCYRSNVAGSEPHFEVFAARQISAIELIVRAERFGDLDRRSMRGSIRQTSFGRSARGGDAGHSS